MAALSNYLENELIDHILRNAAYASPAAVWVALYTDDPTDADTGTEVAGGAYARQAITFGAPANGATDNTVAITFPNATANWGTITHIGIRDANVVGNLLFHGALTTPKAINIGDQAQFAIGELDTILA